MSTKPPSPIVKIRARRSLSIRTDFAKPPESTGLTPVLRSLRPTSSPGRWTQPGRIAHSSLPALPDADLPNLARARVLRSARAEPMQLDAAEAAPARARGRGRAMVVHSAAVRETRGRGCGAASRPAAADATRRSSRPRRLRPVTAEPSRRVELAPAACRPAVSGAPGSRAPPASFLPTPPPQPSTRQPPIPPLHHGARTSFRSPQTSPPSPRPPLRVQIPPFCGEEEPPLRSLATSLSSGCSSGGSGLGSGGSTNLGSGGGGLVVGGGGSGLATSGRVSDEAAFSGALRPDFSPPVQVGRRWSSAGDARAFASPRATPSPAGALLPSSPDDAWEEEGKAQLRYDPTLDCYFDPLTSKYYELNLAGPGAAAATPRWHQ